MSSPYKPKTAVSGSRSQVRKPPSASFVSILAFLHHHQRDLTIIFLESAKHDLEYLHEEIQVQLLLFERMSLFIIIETMGSSITTHT